MLYSVVGGGMGLYGDGVTTFEMYDFAHGDVVLQYATAEEINEYISDPPPTRADCWDGESYLSE
jgi:hypothetical protein